MSTETPATEPATTSATTSATTPDQSAAPTAPPAAAPPPSVPKSRHDELMERLMGQARQTREQQVQQQEAQRIREEAEYARRIKDAAQYGPDALLKAAGVKRQEFDFAKLFEDEKDPKDQTVKQLEERVAKLDEYIRRQEEERSRAQQTEQQRQQQQWAEQEVKRISSFLDTAKDKFEYLSAAREMGTDQDLYNGMLSLYNQGYQPTYEDMADIVESRIEKLIDLIGPTKKFQSYMSSKYGVKFNAAPTEGTTLTPDLYSDPQATADISSLPDEQQREIALKRAMAVRERAMAALKSKA